MTIVDASKNALPASEQKLTGKSVASFLNMTVEAPARVKAFEEIIAVDEDEHRLAWGTRDFPSWALRTERRQVLTRIPPPNPEPASGKTLYECWAFFDGPLAHVLKLAMRKKLQAAFETTARGLKEAAEGKGAPATENDL